MGGGGKSPHRLDTYDAHALCSTADNILYSMKYDLHISSHARTARSFHNAVFLLTMNTWPRYLNIFFKLIFLQQFALF